MIDKIDKLDRRILNIVINNARMASKDIAERCKVSRAAIHQRLQRLIDMRVIVGSGYKIDPKRLGYNICTYIGVRLAKGSLYREVSKELETLPEVVECHYTTGPYSMLIKVYVRDNRHLMSLLMERIQTIPGIAQTETLMSLEQSLCRELQIPLD